MPHSQLSSCLRALGFGLRDGAVHMWRCTGFKISFVKPFWNKTQLENWVKWPFHWILQPRWEGAWWRGCGTPGHRVLLGALAFEVGGFQDGALECGQKILELQNLCSLFFYVTALSHIEHKFIKLVSLWSYVLFIFFFLVLNIKYTA